MKWLCPFPSCYYKWHPLSFSFHLLSVFGHRRASRKGEIYLSFSLFFRSCMYGSTCERIFIQNRATCSNLCHVNMKCLLFLWSSSSPDDVSVFWTEILLHLFLLLSSAVISCLLTVSWNVLCVTVLPGFVDDAFLGCFSPPRHFEKAVSSPFCGHKPQALSIPWTQATGSLHSVDTTYRLSPFCGHKPQARKPSRTGENHSLSNSLSSFCHAARGPLLSNPISGVGEVLWHLSRGR